MTRAPVITKIRSAQIDIPEGFESLGMAKMSVNLESHIFHSGAGVDGVCRAAVHSRRRDVAEEVVMVQTLSAASSAACWLSPNSRKSARG